MSGGEVGEGSILTKVDISNILIWVWGHRWSGVGGHKMVDTFEKMDPINPTFDRGVGGPLRALAKKRWSTMKIRFMYFSTLTIYLGWGHLFNKRIPILTEWCGGASPSEENVVGGIIFRTHPDINTARMTFNHEPSIGWQVCTPPHFNLYWRWGGGLDR
jgi:hypothetical protein